MMMTNYLLGKSFLFIVTDNNNDDDEPYTVSTGFSDFPFKCLLVQTYIKGTFPNLFIQRGHMSAVSSFDRKACLHA